jgi:hypothetical protein
VAGVPSGPSLDSIPHYANFFNKLKPPKYLFVSEDNTVIDIIIVRKVRMVQNKYWKETRKCPLTDCD